MIISGLVATIRLECPRFFQHQIISTFKSNRQFLGRNPENGLPNRSRSLPKNHGSILPLLKMFPNEIWDHPQDHQAFTGSTACGNIPKGAKVFPSKTTFLEARSVAAWQQTRQRQLMMVSHKVINNRCTPIFDQNGATTN